MNIEFPTTKDIERMLDRKVADLKEELKHEISLVGKTEYISLQEVADELGYSSRDSASRWLRDHEDIQVVHNGRALRINRRDFYRVLRQQ